MKERTRFTVRRTTDIPVFVTDTNGEYPVTRTDQGSVTFTVSQEEADAQVSRLRDDNKVLTFKKGSTEYLIPVRHVVQAERHAFIPNPISVNLYEAPDGSLYLERADEDEGIVYPANFDTDHESTNESFDMGALGSMGYRWTDEGSNPKEINGNDPIAKPDGLLLVASYSHGRIFPQFAGGTAQREKLLAGEGARRYIGEREIRKALEDSQS